MDSGSHKIYHIHGFDSRQLLEDYFSDKPDMVFEEDALMFPIENLTKTFTEGHIKGDVLIDLSLGSLVHHLYSACEFFRHIIVLKVSDRCIMELKRWLDSRTGAFNWGHAAKLHLEKEGKSDQLEDTEGKVRSAVLHVLKCDLEKENITHPIVLPPADCIISAWLLEYTSKDQDDYRRYIRKFSRMLKPRGHLIITGSLNTTYVIVGKDKIHCLRYDEDFAKKVLFEEDFIVDYCKVKKRTAVSDLTDYKAVIFIAAHKKK
ncbi:indolethylamine N-methyltransferase-like [Hyla sarda]|uniref:indolethylamine N-methyltransferase-like n=1 Tax=Hyla sarda TaxID=327740 RepID=UPI0024C38356|nr:indolethylamine N-methyltransferase-like [Hyla sarda]